MGFWGASRSSEKSNRIGITKVNIATELKMPFAETLRQVLVNNPNESDPKNILDLLRNHEKSCH